ncbi:MAG: sulfotransferase [Betaproteobacteria bacterium]|nr:sulfotransferase [Betaproteobacteria bacterium]
MILETPRGAANPADSQPQASPPFSDLACEPFFIVGFQRSGTTLLRMMLNAHPALAIPHDSGELWASYWEAAHNALGSEQAVRGFMERLARDARIRAWKTDLPGAMLFAPPLPTDFAGVMRRFHGVYAHLQGKPRWGDKNTGSLVELDRLNALFPSSRFIHLVRDGRDCALSHLSKEYVYGYPNVLRVAHEWREQVGLCRKMGAMLPATRYMEVRYEDLVQAPPACLAQVCAFLGIAYAPEMLDYTGQVKRFVPEEKRGLWPLLDKPPMASNVAKWRRHMRAADRAVFERHAGSLLHELGYETLVPPVNEGRWLELWYELHSRLAWRLRASRQ